MTHYTQAPLPFVGQKRNFIQPFKQVLSRISGDGAGWTIVDVFGGSGLLSHIAKHQKPAARVIYNDYDGYADRLRHIDDIERLRALIADQVRHLPKNARIDAPVAERIRAIVRGFDGYIDVRTLASWILFSSRTVDTLEDCLKSGFYNVVRTTPYSGAEAYLNGLEITRLDFDVLMRRHSGAPDTLLILDPPYVAIWQGAYAAQNYFGMIEFLRLIDRVQPPFVMFGSTKSEMMAYLDYLAAEKPEQFKRFEGSETYSRTVNTSKKVAYEDSMLFKFGAAAPAEAV